MAISPLLSTIHDLERPNAVSAQICALRSLKNELLGHAQRKDAAIRHGIVDALAHVLADVIKSRGKRRTNDANGTDHASSQSPAWTDEDEVQLQVVVLVGTLARGGPPFIDALLCSPLLRLLVESLRPTRAPRLRLMTLKTLNSFVDALRQIRPDEPSAFGSVSAGCLFSKSAMLAYVEILSHRSGQATSMQQVELMARFINSICQSEQHRSALLAGGVLDALVSKLTAYCFLQSFWKQDASQKSWISANAAYVAAVPPAPSREALPWILAATANIVGDSRYRAARLVYSPLASQFFEMGIPPRPDVWSPTLVDSSLPQIPTTLNREEAAFPKTFPVLGSLQLPGKNTFTELADTRANNADKSNPPFDTSSSLVPWLTYILRDGQGITRVFAAELLAVLLHAGFVTKCRERMLALLVVPLLTHMVDDYSRSKLSSIEKRILSETTPRVLAMLIKERPLLERAAVEAGVVERACRMLRGTFQPILTQRPPWSATDLPDHSTEESLSRRVAPPGLPEYMVSRLKIRENILILIAALADKDDQCRKKINDQAIVPYIIDSLHPVDDELMDHLTKSTWPDDRKATELGNPVPILIAACNTIRALSRAVSILRTSLIDAGTAKPAFDLLTHSNLDVVVAATDVMCNLLVDFSPMRADLQELGVMTHLCKHAHSADSRVRLGSLWALKHFVHTNTKEVKISCFEELGTGWLVQIITGGSPGSAKPKSHSQMASLGAANAAGERVDILNAIDEPMDMNYLDNPMEDPLDAENADLHPLPSPTTHTPIFEPQPWLAARNRARIQEIRNQELQQFFAAPQRTELEIQTHGLDFIRNLMLGNGTAGTGELIDCVFNTLGSARIFQIILDKLKPPPPTMTDTPTTSPPPPSHYDPQHSPPTAITAATTSATTTTTATSSSTTIATTATSTATTPPPPFPLSHHHAPTTHPSLLNSAIFIICHIAGGTPTHRTMLTSQHLLLRALLPHFRHPAPSVRVVCVWIVISLTWVDDEADAVGARQRAFELRGLGFESALRALLADESVDVKERVRAALTQLGELVDGVGGAGGGGGGGGGGGVGSGGGSGSSGGSTGTGTGTGPGSGSGSGNGGSSAAGAGAGPGSGVLLAGAGGAGAGTGAGAGAGAGMGGLGQGVAGLGRR